MDSKNTKAMARPRTKRLSKKINPVSGTGAHSQALKSSSAIPSQTRAQVRGRDCESAVEKYFLEIGFSLFSKRLKTPFAEVDLVFTKNRKTYLIEVKSLGQLDFSLVRISKAQKMRLLRARIWLESLWNRDAALAFAYVLTNGEIFIFNEAGEELNLKNET